MSPERVSGPMESSNTGGACGTHKLHLCRHLFPEIFDMYSMEMISLLDETKRADFKSMVGQNNSLKKRTFNVKCDPIFEGRAVGPSLTEANISMLTRSSI